MSPNVDKDYYRILGVSPFASSREIKRAYRRLARRYHPDSREVNTPTTLFHHIQEAYSVLSDPSSRRAYDRQRDELGAGESAALAWDLFVSRDVFYCGHDEQVFYALVEIEPAITAENERAPLDLSIVIDRSNSMEGARLDNVKEAARQIVDLLDDEDRLAVIAFNDRAEVLLSDRVGSIRAQATADITALRAGGGTELLQGILAGLQELGSYRGQDVVGHLILLTDGCTYGDHQTSIAAAARAAERSIGITAMGIGEDWNDRLLDEIASRSGGTSAYIASPGQVRTLLDRRVRSLESVFATGLTLSVHTAEGVEVESAFRVSQPLERLNLSDETARLGHLEMDVPLKVLLEIAVEKRSHGEHRLLQVELNGDVPSLDQRHETLKQDIWSLFTQDQPDQRGESVPQPILSSLSKVTLYRMQEQAWSALEEGHVDQATRQLQMMATRLYDVGEEQLAEAAMLEAEHVAERGRSTERGRRRIKYGTRSLSLGSRTDD